MMKKIWVGLFLLLFTIQPTAFAEGSQAEAVQPKPRKPLQSTANFLRKTLDGAASLTYLLLQKLDVA